MHPTWHAGMQTMQYSSPQQEAAPITSESDIVDRLLRQVDLAKQVYTNIVMQSLGQQFSHSASNHQLLPGSFAHAPQQVAAIPPDNQESGAPGCVHLRDLQPVSSPSSSHTFLISNIPANWGFGGVIHNLHALGIEKGFHYDCLCIPPKAEPNGRCVAFISSTLSRVDSDVIVRLLHGLSRDVAGCVLNPHLTVALSEHQGQAFFAEKYPHDSIFYDESGVQVPAVAPMSSKTARAQEQLSGDVDPGILLMRLLTPSNENRYPDAPDRLAAGKSPPPVLHRAVPGNEGAMSLPQPNLLTAAMEDMGIVSHRKTAAGNVPEVIGELGEVRKQNTSVFINHLPTEITYEMLLELLGEQLGIVGGRDIDFMYLPKDFSTGNNKGVAVVNLRDPLEARRIMMKGRLQLDYDQSGKGAVFTWAQVQGSKANATHFVKKRGRIRNSKMRPLIWRCAEPCEPSHLTNEDVLAVMRKTHASLK